MSGEILLPIKLFGSLRTFREGESIQISCVPGQTVEELRQKLAVELGRDSAGRIASEILGECAFATAGRILRPNEPVPADATFIAVLPPVCGG